MHEALDSKLVYKVVCIKSAQVAWTEGVLMNYIAKRIDVDPCPMIGMFAKEDAAKAFESEKFSPMIEATSRLREVMPAFQKTRDKENRWAYKGFAGGFLKLVGSNSAASVKSTSAPLVFIEEPDDCAVNVEGSQGDSITLLEERAKSYGNRKIIFGGTPTIEGASRIESAFLQSDQRGFYVPCPHCGTGQTLSFEHIRWLKDSKKSHDVYGLSRPETAFYQCPHCEGAWSDRERIRATRVAEIEGHGWKAHAEFSGIAGFAINEVYSPFPGSKMEMLVQKYLAAQFALNQGDDTKMRGFRNNTEGKAYAYSSSAPTVQDLEKRALDYPEFTVPRGGLEITAGVDVQDDRLAVVLRAWGAGEKSWLVWWGEIYGQTSAYGHGAWIEFEQFIAREFPYANGGKLKISAGTIDCSDGGTSDAVYSFVRANKRWTAGKGSSNDHGDREIYTPPRNVDYKGKTKTKADKYGVKVAIIGTTKAKDLILGSGKAKGRLNMLSGPVMHCYKEVRSDYFEQVVGSEVKAPGKVKGKMVYVRKSGIRNEGLDCEVYCLHAARSQRLHLRTDAAWLRIAERLAAESGGEIEAPVHVEKEVTKAVPDKKKKSFWEKD